MVTFILFFLLSLGQNNIYHEHFSPIINHSIYIKTFPTDKITNVTPLTHIFSAYNFLKNVENAGSGSSDHAFVLQFGPFADATQSCNKVLGVHTFPTISISFNQISMWKSYRKLCLRTIRQTPKTEGMYT